MLLEPESRATLMGGQDGQLSAEHICLSQCVSSSRSPPFSQCLGIWNWLGVLPVITLGITFFYIWKGGGQEGFTRMTAFKFNFSTHMRAFKINFSKLFSPHILLRRAGQESWRVDRSSFIQYINCAKFSYVGIVMLCGVVHTAQALWWGEGKYRRLDLTFYKTDKQYQPPILRKQPPVLRKTATHIEKTCSAGSHRNTGQFMKCAREIQKQKWGEIQSEKCSIANGQTGGGWKDKLGAELNLL